MPACSWTLSRRHLFVSICIGALRQARDEPVQRRPCLQIGWTAGGTKATPTDESGRGALRNLRIFPTVDVSAGEGGRGISCRREERRRGLQVDRAAAGTAKLVRPFALGPYHDGKCTSLYVRGLFVRRERGAPGCGPGPGRRVARAAPASPGGVPPGPRRSFDHVLFDLITTANVRLYM